jgi:ElaA protein
MKPNSHNTQTHFTKRYFTMDPFCQLSFNALTSAQLYDILALRSQVFVEEQRCTLPDIDGRDPAAQHLLGYDHGQLVAYLRFFPPTPSESRLVFGRVATAHGARGKGYGKQLMTALLAICDQQYPGVTVKCSAQHYLLAFYEGFGFKAYGEIYEEAGILHVAMERKG